jgi:hypothetical protein
MMLVASGASVVELSGPLEHLSACFQGLAICRLLESGDTTRFRENLSRSAFARRYFLEKALAANNTDDRRLALSRTEAFCDALAAGQGGLARDIAARSPIEWHADWEYSDDFAYFRFLHRVVVEPTSFSGPTSGTWLREFERAAAGDESARPALLRALAERDSDSLNESLVALMTERDVQVREQLSRLLEPGVATALQWPRSFICIEGLALIAIATALRMNVAPHIPLCPLMARLPMGQPAVEDPFRGIDARLAARP